MQDNQPASQPEIDLFYFLRPVGNFGKKVGQQIVSYFRNLERNLPIFITIVVLCSLAGGLMRFFIRPGFETDAIFVSHVMPAGVCVYMMENLDDPALQLDQELNISTAAAASIRKIEAGERDPVNVHRTYDSLLYYNNGDSALSSFSVTLVLKNFKYIDTIQHALTRYIELSPYSQTRTAARKEALTRLRASLAEKLGSMDSVQQIVNNSIAPGREYSARRPINPVDVYRATLYYNKQLIAIDQELSTMDNVEILKPFTRYEYSNYPNYLKLFLLALAAGIILAAILTPLLGKKQKMT